MSSGEIDVLLIDLLGEVFVVVSDGVCIEWRLTHQAQVGDDGSCSSYRSFKVKDRARLVNHIDTVTSHQIPKRRFRD